MRRVCLAAALALILGTGEAWAQAASGSPPPQILVSGVPANAGPAAQSTVQDIIDRAYQQAMAAAGKGGALSTAQLQALAARITATLHKAGFTDAHAYLPEQVVAYTMHVPGVANVAAAPVQVQPAVIPPPPPPDRLVPPLRDRDSGAAQTQQIVVSGFRVDGVGQHKKAGITPASIQALADASSASWAATHRIRPSWASTSCRAWPTPSPIVFARRVSSWPPRISRHRQWARITWCASTCWSARAAASSSRATSIPAPA